MEKAIVALDLPYHRAGTPALWLRKTLTLVGASKREMAIGGGQVSAER
ncbi:MAG: hypothetical protein ACRED0_01445 [Gammaproteobacteria bacterium]